MMTPHQTRAPATPASSLSLPNALPYHQAGPANKGPACPQKGQSDKQVTVLGLTGVVSASRESDWRKPSQLPHERASW